MSGIFLLIDRTENRDLESVSRRIRNFQMIGSAPHVIESFRDGKFLCGRYHLDVFKQPRIEYAPTAESCLVTSGYVWWDDVVDSSLNSGFTAALCRRIEENLNQQKSEFFAGLNGAYQVLCFDRKSQQASIVVDRYGLQPLYCLDHPSCFACASEFDLLFTLTGFMPELNTDALAEFLELGFLTGEQTLFKNVTVFPPGTIATIDYTSMKLTRCWQPVFAHDSSGFDRDHCLGVLNSALTQSAQRISHFGDRSAISLSGGLDSRLLAAVTAKGGFRIPSYTFGSAGSDDHRIAPLVAERLHLLHWQYIDTAPTMQDCFIAGVAKTGGMSNLLDFTGLPHLENLRQQFGFVINGYGGNELLGFHAFDLLRFSRDRNHHYLGQWLSEKLNPGWSTADLQRIRQRLNLTTPQPDQRLADWFAKKGNGSSLAAIYDFFFTEKARRSNLLGVMSDGLHLEPIMPFCDNDIVDLAPTIPPGSRLLAGFYRLFMSQCCPEVADIEYSRTGLPADSPLIALIAKKTWEWIKPPQSGEIHWQEWFSNELQGYMSDHLMYGEPRLSEYVDRQIIEQTLRSIYLQQEKNIRPLGQLLTLELFLRHFRPGTKKTTEKMSVV